MNSLLATELLLKLLTQAQAIGGIIAKAQAEGRDVTAAELNTLRAADDAAKDRLDELIAVG